MSKKDESLLLYHPESNSYFIGTKKDLGEGLVVNVNDDENHQRLAGLEGIINLPMNPQTLAKSGTEHGEQAALMCWANYMSHWYPVLAYLYANANGGSRGDTEKSRAIEGAKMKAEGVKVGVPDLMGPWPRYVASMNANYAGLYIEMKRVDGGDGGSEDQQRWLTYLNEVGYAAQICNGWINAMKTIRKYLEI